MLPSTCRSARGTVTDARLDRLQGTLHLLINDRRAKYDELTRAGRKQIEAKAQDWERLTTAVALVLRM